MLKFIYGPEVTLEVNFSGYDQFDSSSKFCCSPRATKSGTATYRQTGPNKKQIVFCCFFARKSTILPFTMLHCQRDLFFIKVECGPNFAGQSKRIMLIHKVLI